MRTGVVMMVEEILQQPCAFQDVRLWGEQVYSYQFSQADPRSLSTKEEGGGKNQFFYYLFCSHKYHKIGKYFIFKKIRKKI